ncbi:MAG: cysteine hydrolase family protein [Aestuariivirga sp.]
MKSALIVIDLQNDYFAGGRFPLWNAQATLQKTLQAMAKAQAEDIPIVLVKHIAKAPRGVAPFFDASTKGADIHPDILSLASAAPIVVKHVADAFFETNLSITLENLGAKKLTICGMMTQNCVTHTAISTAAEQYRIQILTDCCTTVSEMIHKIALSAFKSRPKIELITTDEF